MRYSKMLAVSLLFACSLAVPAVAQDDSGSGGTAARAKATDRLFLGFAQEATLVDRQWWEAQIEFQDGDGFDATLLRGVAAFQPWESVEFGGRVGFGDSDVSGPISDGSGATDLDLWAKYHFGDNDDGRTEFAAGALFTVPTGDDSVGLGYDAFSLGAFGSMRHRLDRAVLTGDIGLRSNGDGRVFGIDIDGETSFSAGVGILIPANERLSFVGEGRFESERFDGADSDTRLLGGINLGVGENGVFRAAIGFGLSDGAPDAQLVAGYAATF